MHDDALIVLSETTFTPALKTCLGAASPHLQILSASTLDELKNHTDRGVLNIRLAAFCTDVIVPSNVLSLFSAGAYNFHPGPPAYPGIFPSCFAIYEEAEQFGATAHRMAAVVDDGEIVGTTCFDIKPNIDRFTLDGLAFDSVMSLFKALAPQLADLSTPIPLTGDTWLGRSRTKKEFKALCQLPDDVDENEFQRRYRAVGEGPFHALSFERFGHRFKLDNARDEKTVFRGGQSS